MSCKRWTRRFRIESIFWLSPATAFPSSHRLLYVRTPYRRRLPNQKGVSTTHKTIDRITHLADAIANDAEAAVDCRPAVLIEIEHVLADRRTSGIIRRSLAKAYKLALKVIERAK